MAVQLYNDDSLREETDGVKTQRKTLTHVRDKAAVTVQIVITDWLKDS